MDNLTPEERSEVMRKIKSRGNKSTELKTIKILKNYNIKGWIRNYKIKGHPDFVFKKLKIAIFVDGCFWHGCPPHCRIPLDNHEYWERKIKNNVERDEEITNYLQAKKWTVIRIWEHELKKKYFNEKIFLHIKELTDALR